MTRTRMRKKRIIFQVILSPCRTDSPQEVGRRENFQLNSRRYMWFSLYGEAITREAITGSVPLAKTWIISVIH